MSTVGGNRPLDLRNWWFSLAAVPIVGALGIFLYAGAHDHSVSVAGLGLLLAGGAWIAGGVIGFIFGIPRILGASDANVAGAAAGYRSSGNLEQVSDWLTKIIVGVSLVELAKLVRETRRLIDFLGPSLGGDPGGPVLALVILVLFAICGFLALYLFARVYASVLFASTEMSLSQFVTQKVEETQRSQSEKDALALALVKRQLDPDPGAAGVPPNELNAAVAAASILIKAQIFDRARERRRNTWNKPAKKEEMERTIPVFAALIASDEEDRYHRNHAQLAYALKDQRHPDFAAAEQELTYAIGVRDRIGDRGFLIYEFNRMLCRIVNGAPKDEVAADLTAAARVPYLRKLIDDDKSVEEWLAANKTTVDELLSPISPG